MQIGAVLELKITANKVKGGIRRLGIQAGPDDRYSTRDIFAAINELSPLELEAKRARLESVIDEAQFQRRRRQIQEGQFVDVADVERFMDHQMITFVQAVRHSSMKDDEKHMYIQLLRERKLEDFIKRQGKNGRKKQSTNGQHATA